MPSNAPRPVPPETRRRKLIGDVARVAHWLLNDRGYTKKAAAEHLTEIVRTHNDGAWSESDLAQLLGDADALPRIVHLAPQDVKNVEFRHPRPPGAARRDRPPPGARGDEQKQDGG